MVALARTIYTVKKRKSLFLLSILGYNFGKGISTWGQFKEQNYYALL